MGWIRYANGQLRYTGRISYEPFRAWCETREGAATIGALTAAIGFRLLGRRRAARRRLWRELESAAGDRALAAAIQTEIDAYLALRTELALAMVYRASRSTCTGSRWCPAPC